MLHFSEGLPCRSTVESIQTEKKCCAMENRSCIEVPGMGADMSLSTLWISSFSIYHGELEKVDLTPEHVSLKLIAFGSTERCDFQDVSLGCQHQNTT